MQYILKLLKLFRASIKTDGNYMSETFPYQLVGFLDREPAVGEPVYNGKNGWYAQIALKRRFNVERISEEELVQAIRGYCASVLPLKIIVGRLVKPDRMPVNVLEVEPTAELLGFHHGLIKILSQNLNSRFPERDGDNYYPHITAEYGGKNVIDASKYTEQTFTLSNVWLLKDVIDEDSQAYVSFPFSSDSIE